MKNATSQITVGIKTFLRTNCLRNCLSSLAKHDWYEIIIADDGEIDKEREHLYEKYQQILPLKLLRLEFDTGLAAGRNEIVKYCQTNYMLMLDDDETVPENIGDLKHILDHEPSIGGVSGIWIEQNTKKCQAYFLKRINDDLIKEYTWTDDLRNPLLKTSAGISYKKFDFIPNSTLFRLECLQDNPWDPYYKIDKEHLDFYLSHKILGKWGFAVAPEVYIGHHPEISDGDQSSYQAFRYGNRVEASRRYFLKKFGLNQVMQGEMYIEPRNLISYYVMLKRKLKITWKHGFNRKKAMA